MIPGLLATGSALAGAIGLATMKQPKFNTKAPVDALHRQTAAANRAVAAQGGMAGLTPLSTAYLTGQNEMEGAGQLADILMQIEQVKYQGDLQQQQFKQNLFADLLGSGLDLGGTVAVGDPAPMGELDSSKQIMEMLQQLIG